MKLNFINFIFFFFNNNNNNINIIIQLIYNFKIYLIYSMTSFC